MFKTQSRITVDYVNRCSEYDQQYEQILIQSILSDGSSLIKEFKKSREKRKNTEFLS